MHDALNLFADLEPADVAWLLEAGDERQVISSTEVVREGSQPESLWFVLEGLMAVGVSSSPGRTVARIGPGEMFGEIAFLEERPASATVAALENSLLLEVPTAALRVRIAEDSGFASRLHRALARLVSRRLRATTHSALLQRQPDACADSETWRELARTIEAMKTFAVEADKAAQRNHGKVPEEMVTQLVGDSIAFGAQLNAGIGDPSGLPAATRELLGHRVQRELLPLVLLSELGERIYSKPRGYAGDYLTIDIMYGNVPNGGGRLGPAIDSAFREQPANRAVMNRRGLLAEEIGRTFAECGGGKARVTSLASGPAAELFDVFGSLEDTARLQATCIDIDFQALAFVGDKADRLGLGRQIALHNGNLVYLALGRKQLDLPPQDLIYSIGLIDYFADKFVKLLLDWIHDRLRPGGRVILGNFHVDNPSKALMDYVFEWKLIHRSEEDMHRLFAASKFGRGCSRIRYEAEHVNLFAMLERAE